MPSAHNAQSLTVIDWLPSTPVAMLAASAMHLPKPAKQQSISMSACTSQIGASRGGRRNSKGGNFEGTQKGSGLRELLARRDPL